MRSYLALIGMLTVSGCATTVTAGQAGVVWHPSGGTEVNPLGEGLHFIGAFDQVALYDLRTQQRNEELHVLASNGLSLGLDTTIRFHVVPSEVAKLHTEVGESYYDVILGPVLRSQARRVVGRYTPEEIYSTKREIIEREMRESIAKAITGKHIELEAILVRNVELPQLIERAIVDKLSEEQSALKMKYVLEREAKEAERKKVEAQGIAAFQDIVSSKLSDALLKWKQIEALDRLSQSANAKIVMLGAGQNVPPVVLEPR